MLSNLLRSIISRCVVERARKDNSSARMSILSHRIFSGINEIVRGLEKMEFSQAKDIIGRSLRDDYSFIE